MARAALVLFNIAKVRNFGNLLRTANALGVSEVVFVGRREFRAHGAFGTRRALETRHFYTLEDAVEDLRERGYRLAAVEILDDADPVQDRPFSGDTAFLVGNEGQGLGEREIGLCDFAVYVPQYGTGRSLNVNVATAIVLHHFALWSGRTENERDGHGFAPRPDSDVG
ncbi:MAG: TrmH family RNA methyltransferase [Planctomycetota bacterium]|jgi:tRNA G18 (ribose-2'-O)-methylase SpoU